MLHRFRRKSEDPTKDALTQARELEAKGRLEAALDRLVAIGPAETDGPLVARTRGVLLTKLGRLEDAVTEFRLVADAQPDDIEAWITLGVTLLKLEQNEKAVEAFRRAVEIVPTSIRAWRSLSSAYRKAGRPNESAVARTETLLLEFIEFAKKNNFYDALPDDLHPGRGRQLLFGASHLERALPPSVLVAALPKSGSTYIRETLTAGLQYLQVQLSIGMFPGDVLCPDKMPAFSAGGCIAKQHIEASPVNLWCIEKFGLRPIVLVRDPREAIYSWMRHIMATPSVQDKVVLGAHRYSPPPEFFDASEAWRIDWLIDHWLPVMCDWISGWMDVRGQVPISIVQYEELKEDPVALWEKILDHVGISKESYAYPDLPKSKAYKYRSGNSNEWRDAFTRDQIERATKGVPAALFEHFGWRE